MDDAISRSAVHIVINSQIFDTEYPSELDELERQIDELPALDVAPVVHYKDTNTTVLNVKSIEDWQDRIVLDEGEESRSSAVYYADSDDMVRVVRCKNCANTDGEVGLPEGMFYCNEWDSTTRGHWYCCRGERKE